MLVKEIELKKWGNSKGIRLSKEELAELGIKGQTAKFEMVIRQGQIILTPKTTFPSTLEELFSDYKGGDLNET
ncbi:toxin-antitoxin system, antitoxin component, AbrB family protein, partial [Enterococcus faecalis]|uniref:AbrB/MazE/SpoVT family DNA-binding domain-containing protein n=2 Tax=Enterococcus TaxID=1350 RepID=UPI0018E7C496